MDRVETRGVGQNGKRAEWRLKDWGKMTKALKLHTLLARQGRGSLAVGQACKKKGLWRIQGYNDIYSPVTLKCTEELVSVTFLNTMS